MGPNQIWLMSLQKGEIWTQRQYIYRGKVKWHREKTMWRRRSRWYIYKPGDAKDCRSPCKDIPCFAINKYTGGNWHCKIILFLLKFLPTNRSIRQWILLTATVMFAYWWYSSSRLPYTNINWSSSIKKSCPFSFMYSTYLYQYGLMDIYFTLWVIFQYYHYLFYHRLFHLCH